MHHHFVKWTYQLCRANLNIINYLSPMMGGSFHKTTFHPLYFGSLEKTLDLHVVGKQKTNPKCELKMQTLWKWNHTHLTSLLHYSQHTLLSPNYTREQQCLVRYNFSFNISSTHPTYSNFATTSFLSFGIDTHFCSKCDHYTTLTCCQVFFSTWNTNMITKHPFLDSIVVFI